MSSTQQELPRISETDVMSFLQLNPDFFDANPQALADIKLQHDSGKAVSLIERQVTVLREQRKKLKRQLQDLIDIARQNDDLNRRLHQLTLRLINCRRLSEVLDTLKHHLQRDFNADAVTLRLRAIPNRPDLAAFAEFNADAETIFDGFTRLVNEQKPVCGRFRPEQMRQLFPASTVNLGSAALIPLHDLPVFGMLAVGALDAQRFHPEQGTVFLAQLGELVSHVLRGCLAE